MDHSNQRRGAAGKAPSPDKKVNELFRILPEDDGGEGVEICDRSSGVLVKHSIAGAYAMIKKNTAAFTAAQKSRMMGGAA
jgi:hypothetical protein